MLCPPVHFESRDEEGFTIHADRSGDARLAFALAVARGLEACPRRLPSRYLYDDEGSRIFERITEQAEYYPTRTEAALLDGNAAALRDICGDVTLVELGSGSSAKTRRLLEAWLRRGATRYLPIDVSAGALVPACRALARLCPSLTVEGIAACYERGLEIAAAASPLLLLFLGSSLGNFDRDETDAFFAGVADRLAPGDRLLVGVDLVKDPRRLEAAYRDAAGWSARFQLNLFARMNRELGTRVPPEALEYVAFFDERAEQIEMYVRLAREVTIELPLVGRRYRLARGEMLLTEVSRKFRVEALAGDAARFGLACERVMRDPEGACALLLLRRRARLPSREAGAACELLERTRRRTWEIVAPLSDEELAAQPDPLMSPLAWDLGHIAAYERAWLPPPSPERRAIAAGALPARFDPLRNPRHARGRLALPSPGELRALLDESHGGAIAALGAPGHRRSAREDYLAQMVAQHEAQHQETMLAALGLRRDLVYRAPFAGEPPPRPVHRPAGQMVLVPAGPFLMGTDDRRAAYDNERPRREVTLAAFAIDAAPVTNGEYARFVDDGGYRRRDLWSREGWAWLGEAAVCAPGQWELVDGEWVACAFGRLARLDGDGPVMHVCWYEAEAFARWAGKRLPTEAEWEKAAAWDPERHAPRAFPWGDGPPTPSLANLDQRLLAPTPVGSYAAGRSAVGCYAMIGDVWEWTASWFEPYPGFEPFPYREYSAVYFGGRYRVLRGGSWATAACAIRNTFRNWDFPERRQIFAGFRCARDA